MRRRRAEASAEHVVSIVEKITDGFIAIDSNWRCAYLNRAAEEVNRLDRQEGIGKNPWELFPFTMGGVAAEKLRQAIGEQVTVEFEDFYEPWQRWFEVKASPADAGSLAIFFADVTERKLGQMALAQSEERLRLAQQGARAGIWDWDMLTGQITWSDEYYVINGLDRSVAPSRANLLASVHPGDRQRVDLALTKAVQEHKSIDIEYRTIDPQRGIRWVAARGRTVLDASGQPIRTSGIVLDITERKKAEESLRFLSEAGTVLSNLIDFESTMRRITSLAVRAFADVCILDTVNPNGHVEPIAFACGDPAKDRSLHEYFARNPLDWQTAALSLATLRGGTAELVGDLPPDAVDSGNEGRRRLLAELVPRSYMVVPLLIREKAIGTLTFVSSEPARQYATADLELATELARRVAIASENARLYAELKETQRQKDDFLAMLAHELRNPLAAISYANEVSKIMDPGQNLTAETVETIDRQVANLSRLLDDLLDVSRITRDRVQLKREFTDAAQLVRRAVATLQPMIEERQHTLILDVSDEPMALFADPIRIEQILGNLLTNSAKYTPPGGTITVRAVPAQDYAIFTVKDTGLGISPGMLPRIFELFMQVDRSLDRSQGGLGVGLTVAQARLAEMHGGSVSAKSDGLGLGSEFTIRLPLAGQPSEVSSADQDVMKSHPPLKVLMVDDNVDLAESMSQLLKLNGHTVVIAHDGYAALEAAHSFGPDVVLLDLGLPGLDGYRVAQTLRNEAGFSEVRLIAFSGYGQPEDRKRTREAGFDHHLVKPVKLQALLSVIAGK